MKDYLKENIRFVMKTELIVGDGSARELPSHLKSRSCGRIGLVIDRGLYDGNNYARDIVALLEKEMERVVLLVNEMAEPTYDYLDEVNSKLKGGKKFSIVMQIHDELVIQGPRGPMFKRVIKDVMDIMGSIGERVNVPLRVGCDIHSNNWAKGKEFKP